MWRRGIQRGYSRSGKGGCDFDKSGSIGMMAIMIITRAIAGLAIAGFVALSACAPVPPPGPPAEDLSFLPERFERGRVFRVYLAGSRSIPANNWTSQFDFSGVSWNDNRTATAISRRHVAMAGHFTRHLATPLVFHDREGRPHKRRLVGITPLHQLGDIAIGTLDAPLPPEITHYPLAAPGDATYLRAVLVTDQTRTISIHRIGPVKGRRVQLGYDPKIDRRHRRNLVVGDSGNPAFIIQGGQLRLLTTFTSGGPGMGPFYGHPDIRSRISEITNR